MKVFIAESSKIGLRRLLMQLGEIREFEFVGYAVTASSAVVSIDAIKPDIVILDLELKESSGLEVLKTVKRQTPGIVFIILTNSAVEQYRSHCKELGAEYFFDRSTEFHKIPDVLKTISIEKEQL